MAVDWFAVGGIVGFYLLILFVGLFAAWKFKKKSGDGGDNEDEMMLAGRNIGLFVGCFTMTATWVGGGYINGTAEYVYRYGILQTQAPLGYAISLLIGGIVFARKMRSAGYTTMLDPFQIKYGERLGGLLYIPALMGEVFWSAAILSALGNSVAVVLELPTTISIIVSAAIAVFYTLFGGLWSVAYTDVVQLLCILVGLVIAIPYAWNNENVGNVMDFSQQWIGTIDPTFAAQYADTFLLLIFGGIPWQVYFQRVLSAKSAHKAQVLSYIAAVGCLVNAVPPVMIGMIATATNVTTLNFTDREAQVLPLVAHVLTPRWVSVVALGAVSAAVMSSSDSSILSASSMFARNIYKLVFRQKASEREVSWVIRISILIIGTIATVMAISVDSVYDLWFLSSDLVYAILFPQLTTVLFLPQATGYGALAGYIVAVVLRLGGGEKVFSIPAYIQYPYYSEENGQLFPFRTFAMICSLLTIWLVSLVTDYMFSSGMLPGGADVFGWAVDARKRRDRNESEEMTDSSGADKGRSNPALEDWRGRERVAVDRL